MKGLIVRPKWGNDILQGLKPWEIRGSNIKHRGETNIIFSGTSKIYGRAYLVDSFILTPELFAKNQDKHHIKPGEFDINTYKKPYAWVFENPCFYDVPIPYLHPQGAVIWVNV